ncbi:MAG: DUF4097 domain-containing protein [Clostridiales bacterium]|jgi:hypothetical protein|nr:DUF4097 domain-containing protein [Clostridiales bacterium]
MVNDKMKILKMLEENKITPVEAERLMKAAGPAYVEQSPVPPYSPPSSSQSYDEPPHPNARQTTAADLAGYAESFGRKLDAFTRDIEPKAREFADRVSGGVSRAVDRLGIGYKDPRERPAATRPATPPRPSAPTPRPVYSSGGQPYERKIAPGANELVVRGYNAPVVIKGYNGDRLTARIFASPRRAGAKAAILSVGGKYYLDYNEVDFLSVGLEAFVPENAFAYVNVSAAGGSLSVSTLNTRAIRVFADNAPVELSGVEAREITVEAEGGKPTSISGLAADSARVENFAGDINVSGVDVSKFRAVTGNGAMTVTASDFSRFADYYWNLEGGSKKLSLLLPAAGRASYHVKAKSALGSVDISLPGLTFRQRTRNVAEAFSRDFETALKKARIELETSDAQCVVY